MNDEPILQVDKFNCAAEMIAYRQMQSMSTKFLKTSTAAEKLNRGFTSSKHSVPAAKLIQSERRPYGFCVQQKTNFRSTAGELPKFYGDKHAMLIMSRLNFRDLP